LPYFQYIFDFTSIIAWSLSSFRETFPVSVVNSKTSAKLETNWRVPETFLVVNKWGWRWWWNL